MTKHNTVVIIESMNDGEVIHIVGPMSGEQAEEYRDEVVRDFNYDPDFVYIGWLSTPEDVAEALCE